MHYLYFPFNDYEDDRAFVNTKARYEQKYGPGGLVFIARNRGLNGGGFLGRHRGPLGVVGPSDVLIIMAHGDKKNRDEIGVSQGTGTDRNYVTMTDNDLADQIEADGLSRGHKIIKLLSCYAAGAAKYNAKKKTFGINRGKKYFAPLLAEALGLRGYSEIVVGGFPGTVCSSKVGDKNCWFARVTDNKILGLFKRVKVDSDGETSFQTHGYDEWYNAAGVRVNRPPV